MSTPNNETSYRLTEQGEFVITGYNSAKAFSSFFPGLAGKNGIPMWTFYVNRGQCVCSMGVEGKHRPIMEFLPANWAYNLVSSQAFRTFLKFPDRTTPGFYEPLQNHLQDQQLKRVQRMVIGPAQLMLEEENHSLGLNFKVEYFNIPEDNYAGLARRLTIRNLNPEPLRLQILDGLPLIVPYGLDDFCLKHMRRLFEAFVEVTNLEQRVPFFKLKVEPADRPDVVRISKGNFYLGFGPEHELIPPVYDPEKIFGQRGDYLYPERFLFAGPAEMLSRQQIENRLPCAMGFVDTTIAPNRTYTYTSVIGHAGSAGALNELVPNIIQRGYLDKKAVENQQLVSALTQKNFLCSSERVLDQYARQNFLDNVLRGGFPHTLKGRQNSAVLHLYSRKHGDLERDYNDFRLTPTPFSQGNGNFRDVNQNRRCDLYFNPDVRAANLVQFFNLTQLDGFNPLDIRTIRFTAAAPEQLDQVLNDYLGPSAAQIIAPSLRDPFTPGELILRLREQRVAIQGEAEAFLGDLLAICDRQSDTAHQEGFWTDHWTYNLDLLENYLAVYPEEERRILYEDLSFTFYDSSHRVRPRDDKYVLWEGRAMQLNAVVQDHEKEQLLQSRCQERNAVRAEYGRGVVYRTTLYVKLLCLAANKLASLDPEGIGVEMEADKPGWYDALNGLPGLLGSSVNETLELKRLLLYLLQCGSDFKRDITVFSELKQFMESLNELLGAQIGLFEFWDLATSAKENFRALTRLGISGREEILTSAWINSFLQAALAKIDAGLARAWDAQTHVIYTYFINEVAEYEQLKVPDSSAPKCNARNLPCFRARKFRQRPLPLFLEGPVHYLRCRPDRAQAVQLAESVRNSALYDQQLMMYKVNESLADQPMEIGRARTFSPGWFENESVWLHMEYKYLLELLRNGLYTEFYRDFRQVFVPFLRPEMYGRSTLENSSFIVSSANPDPSRHGTGYMARLSGATAEFIHILHLMAVGEKPFGLDQEGQLQLQLKPALPDWLFTAQPQSCTLLLEGQWREQEFPAHSFSFMFLGEILVTYHNPGRKDTFGPEGVAPHSFKLTDAAGQIQTITAPALSGGIALQVRDRQIRSIAIELR